jgi:hypothetical protein
VGLYVYTPTVARQRLGKYSRSKDESFSLQSVGVKEESVDRCISVAFLGNGSVNIPVAHKNSWRRRFLGGPYRIKGKLAISSSRNIFILYFHL